MSSTAVATADGNKWLVLITATFVTMLYAMAVTIASVALPDMRGTLGATQDQITWTITGNLVATAVGTPLAGWLASRFEARNILLLSVTGFAVTTLACGLAQSLDQMVLARVGQGFFGAPLVPVSQALVIAAFPEQERSRAMAIWAMGVIFGPIIAPTLGGYLTEHLGWRWIFFMMLPSCAAAFAALAVFIPRRPPAAGRSFDWIGFLALSASVAAIQIMFDRGERNGWFDSMETIIQACIAALGFYIFIVQCLTGRQPFLDLSILRDRNFTIGLLLVFIFGMLNFVPMVLFPPLLQELRGYPQSIVGLLMGARGAGTLVGFVIMAFAGKVDPRIPIALGFFLQGYAGWEMAQFDINLTTWGVAWTSCLQGFGVGLVWVPVSVVTFNTLARDKIPEATATFHLLRNLASSAFISVSVAVVLHTGKVVYAESTPDLNVWSEGLRFLSASGAFDLESASNLAGLGGELQRQSLMVGYLNAFRMFAVTSFAAVPLVFLIRQART